MKILFKLMHQSIRVIRVVPWSTYVVSTRLIAGAAVFGTGWGIAGFCPGGALPALATGRAEVLIFVVALIAGMLATRRIAKPAAIAVPAE